MKRRNRKARKAHQARHKRMHALLRMAGRQEQRNHEVAVDVLGRTNNAMLWAHMFAGTLRRLRNESQRTGSKLTAWLSLMVFH